MSARIPLPIHLRKSPFTVDEARGAGLRPKRLRGADLDRPFHGIRTTSGGALTVADLARAYQRRMPENAFFCSITAAVVMQVPLPYRHQASRLLHVAVPWPQRAPCGRGVAGHMLQVQANDVRLWHGLRISTPERLWCDLGAILSLPDLVAAGDYLVNWRLPSTTSDALRAAVAKYPGRRGMPALRKALELISDRAESRPESHLRVIIVLAGIAGLAVNFSITTTSGYRYRADLAFPSRKVVIEYQGDYHRSPEQFRADMTRRSRLEADGWFVMLLNADDLRNPAELEQRIRTVLARRV